MSDSGIDTQTMREQEERVRDEAVVVTRCFFCKWTFEGIAKIGREKAQAHREKKHPDARMTRKRRHTRHLSSFRQAGYDDEWKNEVDKERRKRAFLNGVEINSD